MTSIQNTLILLSPELILGGFGLIVLGADLMLRRKRAWLIYLSLLGLALAFLATAGLWGANQSLLSAMLTVDPLAILLKLAAILATGLVLLSAIDYVPGGRGRASSYQTSLGYQGEFYSLLLFAALSMTLMAGATDLIMIALSLEFLSITSYVLTGYLREDVRSNEGAIKYLLYGAITTAVMLYGMSFLYGMTGSTNLEDIAANLGSLLASPGPLRQLVLPIVIFLLAGFGFKIALVPFHQWAPDAYEGAPTPVTAFLSVGPKVAGFAVLFRVFLTALPHLQIDWMALLAGVSAVTMTLGNLVAIPQTNIKRMLAYSSIAQAGYVLIGVAAASTLGMASALFYLFVYTLTNLGAFAVVITFSNWSGSDAIPDYAGLSQKSPALAMTMLLFLISLAGIPPLPGFVGKFYLFAAAIERGMIWLAVIGVINSIISLYYYLMVARVMYIKPPETEEAVPASRALLAALLVTGVGMLLLGIYPAPLSELSQAAARAFFAR